MNTASKRYLILGIVTTLMVFIGVTYAYWRGQIQGEGASMSVTLDNVYIQFTDNTEIAESGVRPGWSTSKSFTVENQGSTVFKYDIYIKDLINTLESVGYFQYKITSDNNGYNMSDYVPIDKSETAIDFDLGTNISIEAGVKQTYTIEFRYRDEDIDQSEDMGKEFRGNLKIEEGTNFPDNEGMYLICPQKMYANLSMFYYKQVSKITNKDRINTSDYIGKKLNYSFSAYDENGYPKTKNIDITIVGTYRVDDHLLYDNICSSSSLLILA